MWVRGSVRAIGRTSLIISRFVALVLHRLRSFLLVSVKPPNQSQTPAEREQNASRPSCYIFFSFLFFSF